MMDAADSIASLILLAVWIFVGGPIFVSTVSSTYKEDVKATVLLTGLVIVFVAAVFAVAWAINQIFS